MRFAVAVLCAAVSPVAKKAPLALVRHDTGRHETGRGFLRDVGKKYHVALSSSEFAPVDEWGDSANTNNLDQLGLSCDESHFGSCGTALTCRGEVCSYCITNKDCPDKYGCYPHPVSAVNMCVPRSLRNHWQASDTICTGLIIMTAILSAAAGLGGGGVYVPLTVLFVGLKTSEAVPLSQAMVCAGAVVNVALFLNEAHPDDPTKPRIAYDVVMLLNPGLAAGVILGVMAHVVSPSWLTLSCLFITLVMAFNKTLAKGVSLFKKEGEARAKEEAQGSGGNDGTGGTQITLVASKQEPSFLSPAVKMQMFLIVCCWGLFLMLNLVNPERCTGMHLVQLAGFLLVALSFSYGGSKMLGSDGGSAMSGSGAWKYPLMACVAGFLGGFLGIGGGLVMGPVLLEMGMKPEVSQATTAMFVLLSSTLGTLQFVLLGKEMPFFALWYSLWVAGATIIGQVASDYVVRVYKRSSLIIFAVAGIILASCAMMLWAGTLDVLSDWETGKSLGLHPAAVCSGHR